MDLTLRGIYKIILLPQATALDLMRSCDKSSQKLWGILTRKDPLGAVMPRLAPSQLDGSGGRLIRVFEYPTISRCNVSRELLSRNIT
jgi:hypothetical protein